MTRVRLRIGIKSSDGVTNVLNQIKHELSNFYESKTLAWSITNPNYSFIGNFGTVDECDVSNIAKQLNERANKITPFVIRLDNLSAYPTWNKPRILFADSQMKKSKTVKEVFHYLQMPYTINYISHPLNHEFAGKFPLGVWRDICSPSLKGSTFRSICVGYSNFASMKVSSVQLIKEIGEDKPIEEIIIPNYEVLYSFDFNGDEKSMELVSKEYLNRNKPKQNPLSPAKKK